MNKVLSGIAICFIFSIQCIASEVPLDIVKDAANTYYNNYVRDHSKTTILSDEAVKGLEPIALRDQDGMVLGYVWQYADGGYIVTSADDKIEPIIMRSATGIFPTSIPNPIVNFIIWDISARLKALTIEPEANNAIAESNAWQWQSLAGQSSTRFPLSGTTWGPLIKTFWTQTGRYNSQCPYVVPYDPGPRRVVGCSATAISQMLNYWQYPKSISFDSEDRYEAEGIRFDDDASIYGFPTFEQLNTYLDNILYDNSDIEVSYLNFSVGLKIQSSYSALGGTSASVSKFDKALLDDFGFGSAKYGLKAWDSYRTKAIENIKKGQPLILAIKQSPPLKPNAHAVILDGYDENDGFFHVNFGWGDNSSTNWYNLPSSYDNYDAIFAVLYDVSTYYGWPQYGFDQFNGFNSPYAVPSSQPHVKYTRTTRSDAVMQGFIIGEGNWIYATHHDRFVSDCHPRITVVDQYGTLLHDVEILDTKSPVGPPVQSPDGDIYFGAGDSVYKFRPRSKEISRVFHDMVNDFYGELTPRVDVDGNMYFGSRTTLVSINKNGALRWEWSVPAGGVMHTGIPSIDSGKDNVYIGYWNDSTDEAVLVCLDRSSGTVRFTKEFSNIISADRGIYTPAIGSDGTIYLSVRTKIYALTAGSSSFSEKWMVDKIYSKHQPIALGDDNSIYTEYWTYSGEQYFLTLAKLNPANGSVVWEKAKPDVGTYSASRQPIYAGNKVVLFPVYWDSSPIDKWQVYAYSADGNFLWDYEFSPASIVDMAIAPGETLCLADKNGNIIALSDGTVGDPRSGGMGYTNNLPPTVPFNMAPTDMAVSAINSLTVYWACADPDGHSLTYRVYLGLTPTDETGGVLVPMSNDTTSTSLSLAELGPGEYNWMVEATDGQSISYSPVKSFVIKTPSSGDLNGDSIIDLRDAILTLQVLIRGSSQNIFLTSDTNNDHKLGLADIIYILQNISNMR